MRSGEEGQNWDDCCPESHSFRPLRGLQWQLVGTAPRSHWLCLPGRAGHGQGCGISKRGFSFLPRQGPRGDTVPPLFGPPEEELTCSQGGQLLCGELTADGPRACSPGLAQWNQHCPLPG